MNDDEFKKYVVEKLQKFDLFMNGNGMPGIKVRVDRLEQCKKTIIAIGTILFLPIIMAIIYLIKSTK